MEKLKGVEKLVKREENKISKNLIREFEMQNKSYGDIGKQTEISPSSVRRALLMINSPTLDTLIRIADALGLKIELRKK